MEALCRALLGEGLDGMTEEVKRREGTSSARCWSLASGCGAKGERRTTQGSLSLLKAFAPIQIKQTGITWSAVTFGDDEERGAYLLNGSVHHQSRQRTLPP